MSHVKSSGSFNKKELKKKRKAIKINANDLNLLGPWATNEVSSPHADG